LISKSQTVSNLIRLVNEQNVQLEALAIARPEI